MFLLVCCFDGFEMMMHHDVCWATFRSFQISLIQSLWLGCLYPEKIILHVCIRLSLLIPSFHLSPGSCCGNVQVKIMLVNNGKDAHSERFCNLPGISCNIVLSLGCGAMKSRHIGQIFTISYISAFLLIQEMDLHASSLISTIPMWLICSWFFLLSLEWCWCYYSFTFHGDTVSYHNFISEWPMWL